MKKLFLACLMLCIGVGVRAQTDITSTLFGATTADWKRDNTGGNWNSYGTGWEQWHGNPGNLNNRIMYKEAMLPAGTYTITAKVNAQQQGAYKSDEVYFYAGNQQVKCFTTAAEEGVNRSLTVTFTEPQELEVGIRTSEVGVVNWCYIQDFSITTESYASADAMNSALTLTNVTSVFPSGYSRDNSGGNWQKYQTNGWEQWRSSNGYVENRIMYKNALLPAGVYKLSARTHAERQNGQTTYNEAYLYFDTDQENCYGTFVDRVKYINLTEPKRVEFGIRAPKDNVNWVTIENVAVETPNYASIDALNTALDAQLKAQAGRIAREEGIIVTNNTNNWRTSLGDDESLEVNTWSNEGASDGSNMLTPFLQNWHYKDRTLTDKTITYPMSGLEPGWYMVGGLFRCLNENGGVTPQGIYMTMNDDEYDMTEGATACTNGTFKSLAKAVRVGTDGLLTIGVKIQNANVNWINWRDFTITKMEDVTQADIDSEWAKMGPCEAALYNAAETAKATAEASLLPSDFTALKEAVAAAQPSIAAYATVKAILDRADAAVDSYDATGKAAYNVTAIKSAYNNKEIATAECYAKTQEVWAAWTLAAKASTTFADGAEVTPLIDNHSFETGELNPWTSVTPGSDYGIKLNSNGTYTTEGVDGQYLFNTWGGSNLDVQQTVSLPAGLYQVKALYASDSNCNATLSANGYSVTANAGASKGVFVEMTLDDVYVTETSDVTIGMKSFDWFKADDFRLTYVRQLTAEETEAQRWPTDDETAAYNAAVEAVANKLGFEAGEYAPYLNAASVTAYEAAKVDLATVKAGALKTSTSTINAISWIANTEEVNAVYDGDFSQSEDQGAPAGWKSSTHELGGATHARAFNPDNRLSGLNDTQSAFFMRFDGTYSNQNTVYTYGTATGAYQMPLKADVEYLLNFDFGGWNSIQKTRFYVTDASGATVGSIEMVPNGKVDVGGSHNHGEIEFTPTVNGNCALHVQNTSGQNSMIVMTNIVIKKANYDQIIYEHKYTKGDINNDNNVTIGDVAREVRDILTHKATANRHKVVTSSPEATDVAAIASIVAGASNAEAVDELNRFIKLDAIVHAAQTENNEYTVNSLTGVVDKKDYSAQASTIVPNILTRVNVTTSGINNIQSISVYAKGKEAIAGPMVAKMMDGTLSYCTTSGGANSEYNGNLESDVVRLTTSATSATLYLRPVALSQGVTVTVQTTDGKFYSQDATIAVGEDNTVEVTTTNDKGAWMATIPGKVHFNQLSLAGGHNAGTSKLTNAAKCQGKTIQEQLNMGVRALDMRPAGESAAGLKLQHGSGISRQTTDIKFTDALGYVTAYLDANPSETVFLLVHNEEGDGTKWGEAVKTCLEGVQDHIKIIDNNMTLDDCRGKMVIIARDNVAYTTLCGKTGWGSSFNWKDVMYATSDNNTNKTPWQLMYQDEYDNQTPNTRYEDVQKLFNNNIKDDTNSNHFFINTMNIAWKALSTTYPKDYAKDVNKLFVDDTTFSATTGRWGITMADFIGYEDDSCYGFSVLKKIVLHNYDYLYNGLGK